MMTTTPISDAVCEDILRALDDEAAFLTEVERCAAAMGSHPIGRAFPDDLVQQLVTLRRQIGVQQVKRAALQNQLTAISAKPQQSVRLSLVTAGPDLTQQLQERRVAVLNQTLSVQSYLKVVLGQLGEANSVLVAVLESILGSTTDTSRYDAEGRPAARISHVEGKRVA
ncbi:MAG: hypothetical protein R3C59_20140 [Planctomycetaceae bacterium]